MNIFEKIYNDKKILDRYFEVERYENLIKGIAYHNFSHVFNVIKITEKLLKDLECDEKFIEDAKIAALLHDTGANDVKEGHAYRSYLFAKDYFMNNNINLKNEEKVLEAIKIHSNGFDTDNIIALTIILADKLDVKYDRISEEGRKEVGVRQYQYVKDIDVKIANKKLIINFIVDEEFDIVELEEYYFTAKIFNAIKAFSKKMNLSAVVLINNSEWTNFNKVN